MIQAPGDYIGEGEGPENNKVMQEDENTEDKDKIVGDNDVDDSRPAVMSAPEHNKMSYTLKCSPRSGPTSHE